MVTPEVLDDNTYNHPKFGVPLGRHNTNDVARYITEKRFSLNRGDESRACYTCNAYSGERFYRNIYILLLLGDTNEYTLIREAFI